MRLDRAGAHHLVTYDFARRVTAAVVTGLLFVTGAIARGRDQDGQLPERRLPDAVVIGVKKCGTRALLEFLKLHPDVRATGPEPHFFDKNFDKGIHWYKSQMPLTLSDQITMEKTPSYFITPGVPKRVRNFSKHAKLIVVVRDPVTRAISDYTQTLSKRNSMTGMKNFEDLAFLNITTGLVDTSWSAIKIGVYAKYLQKWFRYFPRKQFCFVDGENLIKNPWEEVGKVQKFLNLRSIITDKHFFFNTTKGFPCLKKSEGNAKPHCLGRTKGRPHPQVKLSYLQRLQDFYRPFNEKFYTMTGINFHWP